jgi:hypothetical protein
LPLASYSDLKDEVASWLRRSDLDAEVPTFVALAEAQMNRRLRVRPMAARLITSWAAEYVNLPADFLAEREVSVTDGSGGKHRLAYLSPEPMDLASQAPSSGRPRFYGLYGGQLRLHPAPDQAYAAELVYLQAIPALSGVNPSNWLLAAHPDAYLYGALAQSAPYLRADERLPLWSSLFLGVLADIEAADRTGSQARLGSDRGLSSRGAGRSFNIAEG